MTRSLLPFALLLSLAACTKDDPATDSALQDELCDDGVDNDGDGDIDCDDADCTEACIPETETECGDGEDDDQDGAVDCADSDCVGDDACVEDCGDGEDNDLDGLTDCADADCEGVEPCIEDCADGVDNDLDGLTDCADTADCEALCDEAAYCEDGVDNDQDGLTDCADVDCTDQCAETCDDGVDNDGDGFVDCLDNECSALAVCDEVCDDGKDNDQDGRTDCEDADCVDQCVEDCADGIDNDYDSYTDCADDECWGQDACAQVTLAVTGGSMNAENGWFSSFFWTASSYGFAYGSFERLSASGITGVANIDWGSTSADCGWSVDQAVFSGTASYYTGGGGGMALVSRTGFTADCGLGSGALPTLLEFGRNGNAYVLSSSRATTGPLWYGGGSVTATRGGTSYSHYSYGSSMYKWSSYTRYAHTGLEGSEWTTEGL